MEAVLGRGWLARVPPSFSEALLRNCQLMQVADGTLLYDHGSARGGLHGVAAGRMGITLPVDPDGSALVHIAGPGFWTGNVAAFTDLPRQVGIMVMGDSWLFHLPMAAMNLLVAEDPGAWQWFAALASVNSATALEVIDAYATTDPLRRVAKVLLRLNKHCGVEGARVLATQAELAQMARLSRSAVNGALGRLTAAGAVALAYGATEITNLGLLTSLAHDGGPAPVGVTP